jgi:hypothetical protein
MNTFDAAALSLCSAPSPMRPRERDPQKQTATIGVIVAAGGKEMIERITSSSR